MLVVNKDGLQQFFKQKPHDEGWSEIQYIQTNIKSSVGCGTPVFVNFFAPINDLDPEAPIKYDYRSIGEELRLIRFHHKEFCLKQVYKMCFYVQMVYKIEILQMRAKFAIDDHGTIWFNYADEIHVRDVQKPKVKKEEPPHPLIKRSRSVQNLEQNDSL